MLFRCGGKDSDLPDARPKMPDDFNCNTHYDEAKKPISESSFVWFLKSIGLRDPRNPDIPIADACDILPPEVEPAVPAPAPLPEAPLPAAESTFLS